MRKSITQRLTRLISQNISYAGLKTACITFFCATLIVTNSYAKSDILSKNTTDLEQIQQYLNNIKDLSATFVQDSDGAKSEGKFFLSRPGKMRVEYDNSPKILIVVNGSVLTYHDLELDEISSLSTNTTPASFLTRNNISFFAKDVEVTNFTKNNEFMKVSVIKKNRKEAGEFSLIFKNYPFEFTKMEVKNDLGEITQITLKNIDFDTKINEKLFYIRNKNLPF